MKKNTILYVFLAFLIVVNGYYLVNSFNNQNNKRNEGKKPVSFIKQQLNFTESQSQSFEKLNNKHHANMMQINDALKELKDALFNNLSSDSVNEKTVDSLTSLIGNKQKVIETEIFYHFKSIQDLCNDKQKEKLKNILKDALRRGENEDRPPHPNGQQGPPEGENGHRPPPPNDF
ncbi:hypothetical protein KO494_03380 [Lacinutrix sp. C3R15]|uniref:Spy/CpxP family protein refolding chaperone n=1 Tax=Flavobacteriaceae TaxID=49546 RepID=UPI001C08ED92|nr:MULTISPECIES: hypothetical protein [Flavobacteriaceae]MBU2938574.1 hypothetical protein [Lacinutrix sp. C3R15]MDO6621888.1 hypothetical protein [Oceanihabitans sp. 1_MG-2023]